ncbi:protein kinase [Streptomyces sp. NPDC020801]|uniref:serine/threonine-protein kinase n=1 Tax=unclassified Streptomyces TaxID=2593676 RepID=UPI00379446B4
MSGLSDFPSALQTSASRTSALRTSAEVVGDRYRLGPRIGRGGAADVHEAVDVRLGRRVAVKVFRSCAGRQSEQRFAEEAVLLARMDHPGLVTVYDAGRHRDRAYLVMQLVEGRTLRQHLSSGPMTTRAVAGLGTDLAGALAHVHGAGIVHRDVKPSNVLMSRSGDPYLTDFGIARLMDATHHTAPDVLLGTAAYLAPEQALGKDVGAAADVYALGLVLLECLKGRLEYDGTPLEAAVARLHRQPVVPGWIPSPLARLLRDMTALEEEARPDAGRCARVLGDLRDGARGELPDDSRVPDGLRGDPALDPAVTSVAPAGFFEGAGSDSPGVDRTADEAARRAGPSRRLAVGTALTVLSAALGAVLAVAPGAGGDSGDRAASDTHTSAGAQAPTGSGSPTVRPPGAPPSSSTPAVRSGGQAGRSAAGAHPVDATRPSGGREPGAGPRHRSSAAADGTPAQPGATAHGARHPGGKDKKPPRHAAPEHDG